MDQNKICPNCKRYWENDSEQAACIFVYEKCIVCCVEAEKNNDFKWSIDAVCERKNAASTRK